MEEWLVENAKDLKLPPVKNEETIFEYLVNEQGEWEHWYNRVSIVVIRHRVKCYTVVVDLPLTYSHLIHHKIHMKYHCSCQLPP